MKFSVLTASILSLIMMCSIQLGHAVAVKPGLSKAPVTTVDTKASPIEKALLQHKADKATLNTDDNIKVLTAFKTTPSQNFFAEQNLRFTRFVQSIFSSGNS